MVLTDEDGNVLSRTPLPAEGAGYHAGLVEGAAAGSRYRIELREGRQFADPATRFQPKGPHGPSEVIDPSAYQWEDSGWPGVTTPAVVYELHLGTFTPQGTLQAACAHLGPLADLGVTLLELMPVNEFAGRFGWGYDGVLPFAPTRLYGRPDDLRHFVDAAHRHGLGVVLDVVYNHFGPDGCPLAEFSPTYFAPDVTEWGRGLNFDGEGSAPVREYITSNATYWIDEFHLDGLRLDATHAITDRSPRHILADLAAAARRAARGRRVWIVAENEPQHTHLVEPASRGGYDFDALWNDDWHHAAKVRVTGRREAYYTDYQGTPQEFVAMARRGFLYQGQWYAWQKKPRGTPSGHIRGDRLVAFLENHDQVANSLDGRRLRDLASPELRRALAALLILGPWTPMLFQGQEYDAATPFLYFADHHSGLADAIRNGRREFLSQFPSIRGQADRLADPLAEATFRACQLQPDERTGPAFALYRELIALRHASPAFHDRTRFGVDGAVLAGSAFLLRYSAAEVATAEDRLVVVNLGAAVDVPVLSEPLLSAYPHKSWQLVWSSEATEYGGAGHSGRWAAPPWTLSAESATVLAPRVE